VERRDQSCLMRSCCTSQAAAQLALERTAPLVARARLSAGALAVLPRRRAVSAAVGGLVSAAPGDAARGSLPPLWHPSAVRLSAPLSAACHGGPDTPSARRAAPPRRGCQALLRRVGARRPHTPARSLRSRAARAVGPPPRASAAKSTRLALAAAGALLGSCGPCPPRAVAVLALQPGTACAGCARRLRPVCPPGGAQEAGNPRPARRNESLAARRAPSVKATPSGWRAKGTRASLDSARRAAGV